MTEYVPLLRQALANLTPAPSHDATKPPEPTQIYTPSGHASALDPERVLVVGGRGTGKSFWSATLLNDETRDFIAPSYPSLGLGHCKVALGFAGVDRDAHGAPSRDELDDLIERDSHLPDKVWRAVILGGVARFVELGELADLPGHLRGSDGLVAWVEADAARLQQTLRYADEQLVQRGERLIVLFDALDRLGRDWRQIRERTKALLQVALALRTYQAIKPKIFMRVDQAEDRGVAAFPDASKLLSAGARVDLVWERRDLYGLLYTLLANNPNAATVFHDMVWQQTGIDLPRSGTVDLPGELKDNDGRQEKVFVALAGQYMGANANKGRTYTWVFNHLADAHERVSPRSFLEALRVAATHRGLADSRQVVTPKAIHAGIQAASELRLSQLQEEYGWIEMVVEPLAEQQVPCSEADLFVRWEEARTPGLIRSQAGDGKYLEPIEFSDADTHLPAAILKALLRIGVAERRADGRINIPDIYRVAAKMLRKGGVRPGR